MNSSEIRSKARASLQGKWGKAALLSLAYLAVFFVIGLIVGLFDEKSTLGQLVSFLFYLVEIPFGFGFVVSYMKFFDSEEVGYFDFVKTGLNNFVKSWGITLLTALKMILPIILIIVLSIIPIVARFALSIDAKSVAIQAVISIISLIGYIVSICWMVYISYSYQLPFFIAADNPDLKSGECLKRSKELMNGNRFKLFCLELSFIGWAILSCFTLGIAFLWLIPYIQISQIIFYRLLIGSNSDPIESEKQKEEKVEIAESTDVDPIQ